MSRQWSFNPTVVAREGWKQAGRQSEAGLTDAICAQRESSASIKAAPVPYEQSEPAKPKNILEFDCRGLEFTEFKPEVWSIFLIDPGKSWLTCVGNRVSGWQRALSPEPNSQALTCLKASGSTTTRKLGMRSASRTSSGKSRGHEKTGSCSIIETTESIGSKSCSVTVRLARPL